MRGLLSSDTTACVAFCHLGILSLEYLVTWVFSHLSIWSLGYTLPREVGRRARTLPGGIRRVRVQAHVGCAHLLHGAGRLLQLEWRHLSGLSGRAANFASQLYRRALRLQLFGLQGSKAESQPRAPTGNAPAGLQGF
eukprot:1410577-Pyramimonas_sp.AAC.1